ncbi:hypothetical protein PILCRDRAFT_733216 [Piloderma croceum F 1598]|uniref:Uncharacterized protein n=1 Tax=Piloderma croceum (strain F 1598) TaxID=765440 RepID=A0A0C3EKL2_PILCF|nr:hypothetical protein PILCRDRAFT_733216 [Piloderma croceum F 1598]
MVIRYMLWRKHGKGDMFGNFKPKVTKPQQSLFRDLYNLLLKGADVELTSLAPLAHRILLSSFTLSLNARNQVDSAFEQFMIFAIMTPSLHTFLSALCHTQLFARTQRTIFSTFLHTAWHGGADTDFKLEDRGSVTGNDEGNKQEPGGNGGDLDTEADDTGDDIDFHQFDEMAPTAGAGWDDGIFDDAGVYVGMPDEQNADEDADEGMEILTDWDGDDVLLRLLYDFRKYTNPSSDTIDTLMKRVVTAWGKAKPLALQTTSNGGCSWNPDGQSFVSTWMNIKARDVDLECLRLQVIKEKDELTDTLTKLFPYVDFSTFLLSKVADNVEDQTSLFDRQDNKALFKPFIEKVWAHLGRDRAEHPDIKPTTPIFVSSTGKLLPKQAKEWLRGPRLFLRKILRHFYRTIGIPPRAWQTSELLYRARMSYLRNFRVLRHGTPFVGNPRAKQRDKLMYEAFWLLPPHLGLAIIFCLGVIRPIEIEILKMLDIPTTEALYICTYKEDAF